MENKTYKLTYNIPSFSKIIASYVFDIFSLILISVILLSISLFSMQETPSYKDNLDRRNSLLVESKLYVKKDSIIQLSSYLEDDSSLTYNEKSEIYNENMLYFFTSFINDEINNTGLTTYNSFKKEGKYQNNFLFNDELERNYTSKDYDVVYYNFYKDLYSKSLGYLVYDSTYIQTRNYMRMVYIVTFLVTISFSYFIVYLFIPLIFNLGKKTLGMKFTRLSLLGVNGFSLSISRFLLRFLLSYFLMFLGSIFGLLIPCIISITMSIYSKRRQSLLDYICNTYLIDSEDCLIFKNDVEYALYLKRLEENKGK